MLNNIEKIIFCPIYFLFLKIKVVRIEHEIYVKMYGINYSNQLLF